MLSHTVATGPANVSGSGIWQQKSRVSNRKGFWPILNQLCKFISGQDSKCCFFALKALNAPCARYLKAHHHQYEYVLYPHILKYCILLVCGNYFQLEQLGHV